MPELTAEKVENYLRGLLGGAVKLRALVPLDRHAADIKGYGYGTPVRIDYELGGEIRTAVLHTVTPGGFGHERMPDRARELLWERCAFNRLPQHVRSLDVGGFINNNGLISLGNVEEFFLLTEYAQGREYAADLERIRRDGVLSEADLARADALCDYLCQIHKVRGGSDQTYVRRVRELIGGNDCILGLIDSYPQDSAGFHEQIECLLVRWRWKLRRYSHACGKFTAIFIPGTFYSRMTEN